MLKKIVSLSLITIFIASTSLAKLDPDQRYINRLKYRNNKLELVTKKRFVDEKRSYSNTDINTTVFSYEAYSDISTDINTSSLARSEVKEINEWYIYKGGVRKLSDLEFVELVNDKSLFEKIYQQEQDKAKLRNIGNIGIGIGLVAMIAGSAMTAGQNVITGGALAMTAGFFFSAFNQTPSHYIQADYAQSKILEYNVDLKKKLGLPLTFE